MAVVAQMVFDCAKQLHSLALSMQLNSVSQGMLHSDSLSELSANKSSQALGKEGHSGTGQRSVDSFGGPDHLLGTMVFVTIKQP